MVSDTLASARPRIQPGMAGSLIASTTLFALAHGIAVAELEAATGFAMADLSNADLRFPNYVLPRIWQLLCAAHPGVALPLRMASAAPHAFFGPLAYGLQYASSLREGIELFLRYRRLFSDELEGGLRCTNETSTLWVRHRVDELDGGAAATVGLALALRFYREVAGVKGAIRAARFAYAPIGAVADYQAMFETPVEFEASENALVFASAELDRPLPAGDERLFGYIRAHFDLARQQLLVTDELAEVREAIARNASRSEYGAEALAASLGMSLRALQRYVGAHGSTVRELLDQAREANARELLGDRRLSVEEVGFLIGYSDERAFRRAFKRMTGSSPAQFRRAQGSSCGL